MISLALLLRSLLTSYCTAVVAHALLSLTLLPVVLLAVVLLLSLTRWSVSTVVVSYPLLSLTRCFQSGTAVFSDPLISLVLLRCLVCCCIAPLLPVVLLLYPTH